MRNGLKFANIQYSDNNYNIFGQKNSRLPAAKTYYKSLQFTPG